MIEDSKKLKRRKKRNYRESPFARSNFSKPMPASVRRRKIKKRKRLVLHKS